MTTNTIDAEVQRLVQAERDREERERIERIKAQVLERQADEQEKQARIQRIADYKAQAAQLREQAAAVRAEAEPHYAALERIEGVRPPTLAGARSVQLELAAHRMELNTEELEWRLQHPR